MDQYGLIFSNFLERRPYKLFKLKAMSIFISAIVESKKGHSRYLKPLLYTLVNESRAEKACLQFDLHQSIEDENIFIINEEWVEKSWFELHLQQEHVSTFISVSENYIENKVIIYKSERIA